MFQQSKMAAMGEILSNIAHQWRQPLSVISTTASGIELHDELGILSKESPKSGIQSILKNMEYLSNTVDNFRDFFSPNKLKETKDIDAIFDTIDNIFGNSLVTSNIKVDNIEFTYENKIYKDAEFIISLPKDILI
jgi:signal transduction histidine kinase